MEFLRTPSPGLQWHTVDTGFGKKIQSREIDPASGVTTVWQKEFDPERYSWDDLFPDNGPKRAVSSVILMDFPYTSFQVINNEVPFKMVTVTTIGEDLERDTVGIHSYLQSASWILSYRSPGINEIYVIASRQRQGESYSELSKKYFGRTLQDNFKDLASRFEEKGELVFSLIHDSKKVPLEESLVRQRERLSEQKQVQSADWTDEQYAHVINMAVFVVKDQLITTGFDDWSEEKEAAFGQPMIDSIVASLPKDLFYYPQKEQVQKYMAAVYNIVAALLVRNETNDREPNGRTAGFRIMADDGVKFSIGVGGDQEYEKDGKLDHIFEFEGDKFSLERRDKGRLRFRVDLIDGVPSGLILPSRIDCSEVRRLVTLPKAAGWEESLNLVPLSQDEKDIVQF